MPKISLYIIIFFLLLSVIYLKINNNVLSVQLKTFVSICNYKSVTSHYSLDQGKFENLQISFKEDIKQLINNYDSNLFEKNKLLSNICQDLEYIKQVLSDKESQEKIYLIKENCDKNITRLPRDEA